MHERRGPTKEEREYYSLSARVYAKFAPFYDLAGRPIGFWPFFKVGFPVTIFSTVLGLVLALSAIARARRSRQT